MLRITVGASSISGCKIRAMSVNLGKMERHCNQVLFFESHQRDIEVTESAGHENAITSWILEPFFSRPQTISSNDQFFVF